MVSSNSCRIGVERAKAERWDGKLPQTVHAGAPIPCFSVPANEQ